MDKNAGKLRPPMYDRAGPPFATGLPPAYEEVTHHASSSSQPKSAPGYNIMGDPIDFDTVPVSENPVQPRSPASSASDDSILQRALDFTHRTPPPILDGRKLEKPVVIPQVANGTGMPFARAYAPALLEHGISVTEFVEFIDNLDIVLASNPALQVLDLAGSVVGMVPFAHAQLISSGISAVAKLGNVALMKTRGALYLKKANSDFFNPRGLSMEIVKGRDLRAKLGMAASEAISVPLDQCEEMSNTERKMLALQAYTSPLTFDVPPPSEPTNVLNKLCAKQQAMIIAKQEKKAQKYRGEYHESSVEVHAGLPEDVQELDNGLSELDVEREQAERKRDEALRKIVAKESGRKQAKEEEKVHRDFEKELRKIEKGHGKKQKRHEKEMGHGGKDRKKEEKEAKKSDKIAWILVQSL